MPALLPWIERTFDFSYPVEWYPDIVERFRGLPARVEDRVRLLPAAVLTRSDGHGWTIQEKIGHLLSLEPLFDGRIDDFLEGLPMLRAADMTNAGTHAAGYNRRPIGEVLAALRAARQHQAARLDGLGAAAFSRVSVHPRLKRPMRLVDAVCFCVLPRRLPHGEDGGTGPNFHVRLKPVTTGNHD